MRRGQKLWDVFFPLVALLVATILATAVVMILLAVISLRVTLQTGSSPVAMLASGGTASLIATMLADVGAVVFLRRAFRIDEMRFFPDARRAGVATTVFAVLAAASLSNLLEIGIVASGIYERFSFYQKIAQLAFVEQHPALLVLAVVLVGPFAEEFIFRGLIYRRMRAYLGCRAAMILSALLFGLWHFNVVQFLFATALGIFFAWIYEHTQTLLVPFLCHAAANAWSFLASALLEAGVFSDRGFSVFLIAEAVTLVLSLLLCAKNLVRRRVL